jgi:DNA-binding response OmpR family regulator
MTCSRVLLIDDDGELLRQMTVAFVSAGYEVQAASDGQAGLARFLESPTDLVDTDIIMPNREGIETIIALKMASPSVRILAISGAYRVGPADFLVLAGHLGADGVLAKPFRPSDLIKLALNLLEGPPAVRVA